MDKTDTIVDFLQMIFKIITENLQTGNTSASQNSKESQFPTHSPDINQSSMFTKLNHNKKT